MSGRHHDYLDSQRRRNFFTRAVALTTAHDASKGSPLELDFVVEDGVSKVQLSGQLSQWSKEPKIVSSVGGIITIRPQESTLEAYL